MAMDKPGAVNGFDLLKTLRKEQQGQGFDPLQLHAVLMNISAGAQKDVHGPVEGR